MIYVRLIHTVEFGHKLNLPNDASDEEIKQAIEKLTMDDFQAEGQYQHTDVFRILGENFKEVHVDSHTPKLNPDYL